MNIGAAIKYIIGTGTEQTYAAPFQVNQSSAGVESTNITIKYWSIGVNGTEPQKSITYNTSGAVPSKTIGTATNGNNQVVLNWNATANTTAYTVYRSTVLGTLGTMLAQYLWKQHTPIQQRLTQTLITTQYDHRIIVVILR